MSGLVKDFVGARGEEQRASDADPVSHAIALADGDVIGMVRSAVQSRRLRLAFQPIMRADRQSQPVFHEGLIRVLDPSGRVIPARDFIGAVQETDLGRMIDCAALEMALGVLLRHPTARVSVNVSARSIGYPRWIAAFRRGLRAGPNVGARLILELNEMSVNLLPEIVAEFMFSCQSSGVTFALDGFAAGPTLLKNLRDFYFDILKIDGQFSRGIAGKPDTQMLVSGMVLLARHFDLMTVAEAVETQAEADVLHALGVDCLQGYHLGAPAVRPDFQGQVRQQTA